MIVTFDRIGRTGTTPSSALTVTIPEELVGEVGKPYADRNPGPDADGIAAFLYRHCKKYLVSRDFEVVVDLIASKVYLSGGFHPFGTGIITEG